MQTAVERELIRRCQAGDEAFYEPLVRGYEQSALRVATGMLGDAEEARDAVQDAFIKTWNHLDRFDPDRPFAPWFFRILRNGCRDRLKLRRPRFSLDALEQQIPGGTETPERAHRRREAHEVLWRGLERLSEEHREVLVLKELEGLRYAEIAEVVGISDGTVASRLYHARKALRQALEEMGAEAP